MRGPVLALVAALAFAACASRGSQQQEAGPASLTGCYQFEWTEAARELGLPWGFELLDEPFVRPGYEEARVAVTRLSATRRADHPFQYWRPAAGDSIDLGYAGRGAFSLTLAPGGGDLFGVGVSVGDAVGLGREPDRSPRPVTARRVLCPDPVGQDSGARPGS